MRFVFLLLTALGLILFGYSLSGSSNSRVNSSDCTAADNCLSDSQQSGISWLDEISGGNRIAAIEKYSDPDYGFEIAVPAGWRRIVLANDDTTSVYAEPGYAVGFEAHRDGPDDQFADYILIEVLPGTDSGLFESTSDQRDSMIVDGQSVFFDKLYIDSETDQHVDVDLVIFQRELTALGYTVDFYAIGEPANEAILFDAFQIMLHTFEQAAAPFNLS